MVTNELLDKIQKETGAHAVFLVISDASIPCPDVRAGEDCRGGHKVSAGGLNLDPLAIPQIIADATGVTDFDIEPFDGDDK